MKTWSDCTQCGRPMRPNRITSEEEPDRVAYGADGLCGACYKRSGTSSEQARDADAIAHMAAGNYGFLKNNTRVELVKWVKDNAGWDYRTVKGTHRGHTETHWQVEVLGEVVEYDRTVWEVTVP